MAVFGPSAQRYVTPGLVGLMLLDAYHDGSKITRGLVRRYRNLVLCVGTRGAAVELARNYGRDQIDP
ncbi:MAG: hypothetical protein J07HX64_00412 [halophilic archaeon J07HX64]|nr:MAG: hypothetical protein J07HX64_00412 [halophilic archaeon J07HX64]